MKAGEIMPSGKKIFLKEFFVLALPIMLQQLSGTILNICDTIMVGKISDKAISAVTVANKTYLIYALFIFGISSGIMMFMSQYYGAEKFVLAKNTLKFGLQVCIIIALIFVIAIVLNPQFFIHIFVRGDEILHLGTRYIRIVVWSYIPMALSQMLAVYFRVFKKQNIPGVMSVVSVGFNILFNYMLIYGKFGMPKLGIEGAAIATTAARYIEFIVLFSILMMFNHGKEIFMGSDIKLNFYKKVEIIKKTIPLMFNEGMWAIALSLVFRNYCHVSETYIPAITVVDNVFDLLNVAFYGCSVASGIVIGKVLGTGDMKKAWITSKKLIAICLTTSVSGAVLICALSGILPRFFSLTGSVFTMATTLLIMKAAFGWTQGYSETIYYIIRAGGDVKAVLVIDGLFMLYGPFLMSTVVSYGTNWPIQIVYLCTEATYIIKIIVATYFYRRKKWCRNLTEEQS